jgi:hypothetical protein
MSTQLSNLERKVLYHIFKDESLHFILKPGDGFLESMEDETHTFCNACEYCKFDAFNNLFPEKVDELKKELSGQHD